MKRLISRILFLLSAMTLAVCACTTTHYVPAEEDIENIWKGKTYSEIVQMNGAPDRESSDGENGLILVYENVRTMADSYANNFGGGYWYGPWGHNSTSISTEVRNEVDYIQFYIGADKVCYKVRSNLMKADGTEPDRNGTIAAAVGGGVAALLVAGIIIGVCR